jgi:hypothetical protein
MLAALNAVLFIGSVRLLGAGNAWTTMSAHPAQWHVVQGPALQFHSADGMKLLGIAPQSITRNKLRPSFAAARLLSDRVACGGYGR